MLTMYLTTKTFQQFEKDHQREAELQIKDLKKEAHFVLDNNGSKEEFCHQIDEIIQKQRI